MYRRFAAALVTCLAAVAVAGCESEPGAATPTASASRTPEPPVTEPPQATPLPPGPCSNETKLPAVYCADTTDMEAAHVVRIIDGDTFDVTIDGRLERIRVFGIDTPERGDRCFAEAATLLESLVEDEVRLRTDVRTVDRSGRLLRYVYRPDGLSVDAMMLAGGGAYAWTRDGALRDELLALEAQARLDRTGCLWR
jgi:endonuclease YncB( thermonuclease family)